MDHIKKFIDTQSRRPVGSGPRPERRGKERSTERGELMEYFRDQLNRARVRDGLAALSMPRMGKVLQAIPTKDLYYLKSVCDLSTNFSKKFWWEISPKNHLPKKHAPPQAQSALPKKKASK